MDKIKIVDIETLSTDVLGNVGTMVRVFLNDGEDRRFQHSEIGFIKEETLYLNNFNSYKFVLLYDGVKEVKSLDLFFDN